MSSEYRELLPKMRLISAALTGFILISCGGSGDNADLKPISSELTAEDKDSYYIPAFDNRDTTFALEGQIPGDTVYQRALVVGLATGVEAKISYTGDGAYALNPGTSLFGIDSFTNDPTSLDFTTEDGMVTNGTWVWVKQTTSTDFGASVSSTVTIGDGVNPETGTEIDTTSIAVTAATMASAIEFPQAGSLTSGDTLILRGKTDVYTDLSRTVSAMAYREPDGNLVPININDDGYWTANIPLSENTENRLDIITTTNEIETDIVETLVVHQQSTLTEAFPDSTDNSAPLEQPEDLTIVGSSAFVIDSGTNSVTSIDLTSGNREVIVADTAGEEQVLDTTALQASSLGNIITFSSNDQKLVTWNTEGSNVFENADFNIPTVGEMAEDVDGEQLIVPASNSAENLGVFTFPLDDIAEGSYTAENLADGFSALSVAVDTANSRVLAVGPDGIKAISLEEGDEYGTVVDFSADNARTGEQLISIAIDTMREAAIVADAENQTLYTVSLEDGSREVLSSPAFPSTGTAFQQIESVTVDTENDRALVLDAGLNALIAVDLMSGERVILSKSQ